MYNAGGLLIFGDTATGSTLQRGPNVLQKSKSLPYRTLEKTTFSGKLPAKTGRSAWVSNTYATAVCRVVKHIQKRNTRMAPVNKDPNPSSSLFLSQEP